MSENITHKKYTSTMHKSTYLHIYISTYVYIYIYIYTHTHMYIHTYIQTHIYMYIYIYKHIHAHYTYLQILLVCLPACLLARRASGESGIHPPPLHRSAMLTSESGWDFVLGGLGLCCCWGRKGHRKKKVSVSPLSS